MAVLAHPDDEAFGLGGTLSRYAAEGCDVYLVTATRGEAGQIAEPDLATKANLPQVRERELRCACQVYGIHPPFFLDYVDGQLPIVHQGQAVGKIVHLIRKLRPQVLITFGPEGIYGHYDHIAAYRWSIIAVDLAADPRCFPEDMEGVCQPHQVSKVYFRTLTEEQVRARSEEIDGQPAAVMMDGVPFYFVGRPEHEITTFIDVSAYVDQKRRGIACHVSQVGRHNPYVEAPEAVMSDPDFQREIFVLDRSTVGRPEGVEEDLFLGVREGE
jgi:LmbE family N-acetylglucosaminyl deacetylase